MPAFTFEKISPPVRSGPIAPIETKQLAPIETKQRGVIVQMLDRIVEARIKRKLGDENGVIVRNQSKPTE